MGHWEFASRRERFASTCRNGLLGDPGGDLGWSTFLRNEATAILACDSSSPSGDVSMLYVFVVIEPARRLAHVNVMARPSAARRCSGYEVIADADGHGYLIHDRRHLREAPDGSIRAMGLRVTLTVPAPRRTRSASE
jgi:hypothetical protein